jgi:uncharacterized repeat protein (TIGR02543 family)
VSGGPDYEDSVYLIKLETVDPQHPRLSSLFAGGVEAELSADKLVYPLTAPYEDGGEADVPFVWSVDGSQVKSVFYSFNKGSSWIEDTDKDGFSGELSLSPGESAVVLIKALTFDGKTGVYYIPVNRAPDNSAALSALTAASESGGTPAWSPAFSPNDASALNYTVAFPKDASISTQNITLTATAASPAAKVEFVGETGSQFTLAPGGQKTAVIRVTAQNGSCLDYIISVKWTETTYTATFEGTGGYPASQTASVTYPASVAEPVPPQKAGYTFSGWYTTETSGGSKITFPYQLTSAKTFYARWTVNSYTVKFMVDGNSKYTYTVNYNGTQTLPALPTKTGSVAKGWYTASSGGQKLTGTATPAITANTDFYVQWLAYTDAVPPNASGGEIKYVSTNPGFDEVHIFTDTSLSGSQFKISRGGARAVKALIVAGGGGGGGANETDYGGGGGAGGLIEYGVTAASETPYVIKVGAGGPGGIGKKTDADWGAANGGDSSAFGQTATGGGRGGAGGWDANGSRGDAGGSGGGGGGAIETAQGNSGSGTSGQGNNGGKGGTGSAGGGGGGKNGKGSNGGSNGSSVPGGSGATLNYTGSNEVYAQGGNGGGSNSVSRSGYGTGGKGGGTQSDWTSGENGVQGVVIIKFPYVYTEN